MCIRDRFVVNRADESGHKDPIDILNGKVDGFIYLGEGSVSRKQLEKLVKMGMPAAAFKTGIQVDGVIEADIDLSLIHIYKADAYREMHFEDAMMFIPYGCMVDEFQHIVYANPDLTPAQRKEAWSRLEKEYKPHLDYEGDEFFGKGGYWQQQHHIYSCLLYTS